MKKTLLMLLVVGVGVNAGAQSSSPKFVPAKPIPVSHSRQETAPRMEPASFYVQGTNYQESEKKKGGYRPEASGPVHCGSAYNLYGVLDANTTAVTYDSALGLIMFTHREDDSKFSTGGSGAYEESKSFDGGQTWDTNTVMFSGVTTRYPNGVVYNPTKSTTLANAYWVNNGPVAGSSTTDVWTGWDSIALGSMSLSGTNTTAQYKANGKAGVVVEEGIEYMSVGSDGIVHSTGDGFHQSTSGYTYLGSAINYGTFNGTSFTWTQQDIRPHLMPSDHNLSDQFDSIPELMSVSGTAWSQDGTVGYAVFFGNLDSTNASTGANMDFATSQPIVYKTTNSGATWTEMTPHNWRNDPVLVNYLHPSADSAGVTLPIWGLFNNSGAQGGEDDYDMVVDANYNLHIISAVTAASIANPDSSEYYGYFNPRKDFIFDMYTTSATGGWMARYIDTLASIPSYYCQTGVWNANLSASAPLAMGHRIQATRSNDGKKIFATWLDDVSTISASDDSMQYPDMFGQGYDISTGYATPIKQFTNTADRYYICVSDKPMITGTPGNYTYRIPVVRVESPGTPNDGLNPVYFLYDTTDVYTDADFQSIPTISANNFSITANYPNPFNGITRFDVNLTKESTVSVDVYNIVGQKMITINPVKMQPGSHTFSINANGFATGVYFYRVNVDGNSLSHKMIVE